jgi:hypothetical protein
MEAIHNKVHREREREREREGELNACVLPLAEKERRICNRLSLINCVS